MLCRYLEITRTGAIRCRVKLLRDGLERFARRISTARARRSSKESPKGAPNLIVTFSNRRLFPFLFPYPLLSPGGRRFKGGED